MSYMISDLKTLKVKSDNKGFIDFFDDAIKDLNDRSFGCIIVNNIADIGAAGYYDNKYAIDSVTLDEKYIKYDKALNTIEFCLKGMLVFIHEISHFQHLCRDKGVYKSPTYATHIPAKTEMLIKDDDNTFRYSCEYEAGYRCEVSNIIYEIFDKPLLKALNLQNLITFKNPGLKWIVDMSESKNVESHVEDISNFVNKVCNRFVIGKKYSDFVKIDDIDIELTESELKDYESLLTKLR